MVTRAEVGRWASGLEEVAGRIGPRFVRAEPRRRAAAYLCGLLALVERKNGWQLAEAAGDATPDGVQDFLSRMRWDADVVRDGLVAYVVERLAWWSAWAMMARCSCSTRPGRLHDEAEARPRDAGAGGGGGRALFLDHRRQRP